MIKGSKATKETKLKQRLAKLGKRVSDDVKKKISTSLKGVNTWSKGSKLSEETKKKIGDSGRGKKRLPRSEEWKKKQSMARLGKKHNHKTSNGGGWKLTDEQKKKLSIALSGQIYSEERKKAMSEGQKGKKQPLSMRIKTSERQKGSKSHFWKGGISKFNRTERRNLMGTLEYKLWREAIFKRDNYTCVFCGVKGVTLNADHIKEWCNYPELRFAIDNGRTLCVPCHKTTSNYGGKAINKIKC